MTEFKYCPLCPHHCKLREGQTGICRVRTLREGRIEALNYGQAAAWHLDPIEKKPLYHFYPGTWIFSVGAFGCNLRCFFCQNYEISQAVGIGQMVDPEELAQIALREESLGICFTYSEPLMWYEMIKETAPLVKKQGGKVVLVSNGIIEGEYLEELIPDLDAANIDIKAFTEEFYRKHTGGRLEWVLNTVERLAGRVHLEITTLIVPGLNDSPEEIKALAVWLKDLKHPLAWHLTRYYPRYKSNIPPTDPKKLQDLWELAKEFLPYVYLGNMPGGSTTFCPQCGKEVITRDWKIEMKTIGGKCRHCGREIWGSGLA
ncbi:MAG TPA: AmmeMemoRadiSam system radical SAM enzyme [Peptococcaceae bacterium]|nr:AmmeMemoRadiSam system radical SAM enzyme [Peptococcaceae bacterium]